ncbi:cytochrome C biogenesis protein [Comamonas serinivorans]|uniref:Cytochrome C biogenesis protein n=1 Tax=Comamonas serinivorans TaxID=1082851 RepID=A0A1Y0ENB6_9BURK|nr:DnaJ C-terminal domain-containing protein [Comamonas serinivorans]ARU04802.1 cytochrome C biogenesis protein [Comamonas serinivorans]
MEFKDYYQSLGVDKAASPDDVRKAYRKLARKYHPDVSQEADAQDRMREVNEAYEVLGNAEKRAAYDALAEEVARGGRRASEDFRARPGRAGEAPPDWERGFHTQGGPHPEEADFSDFFSTLFSNMGQRRREGAPQSDAPQRGDDQHARIEITFRDAFQGATTQLDLRALEWGDEGQPRWVDRRLEVKIPKGVRPGQLIRLGGQGLPGTGGAPAGDLLLEVAMAPDPVYRADGLDIYMQTPVTPSEAALGAKIEVPTPAGTRVEVTVPPNARPGMKLRLKERGFAAPGETGHLYLVLELALPPALDDATRAAYQALAEATRHFNPRQHLGA